MLQSHFSQSERERGPVDSGSEHGLVARINVNAANELGSTV